MAGWPNRTARLSFGPTYEDEVPVANPRREMGQAVINLFLWQLAGGNLAIPKAMFVLQLDTGAIVTVYQGLTWDPDSALGNITWSVDGTGQFSITFAADYPDQSGVSIPTDITAGDVSVMLAATPSIFPRGFVRRDSAIKSTVFIRNGASAYDPTTAELMIVRLF